MYLTTVMDEYNKSNYFDEGWKEAIELYFKQFLELLFPDIHKDIDFDRGYQFLDKELEKILKENLTGKRRADKLVKVYLKDGSEKFILIHIEVQGQSEREFEKRMYVYNYRIYDRYNIDVVSLAILADDNKNFRPGRYEVRYWGFRYIFEFPSVKLLDYQGREEELNKSENIFANIILAHIKSLETKGKIDERLLVKKSLIKGLYEKRYSKEDIINLYRFMDWIMSLPKAMEKELYKEIKKYEEEVIKMPYLSTAERVGLEKGIEKGIEQGRAEVVQKIAKKMLAEGMDIETIAKITGLKKAEIIRLKQSSK